VYSGKFLDATVMEKPETIDAYIDSFPGDTRRMARRDAIPCQPTVSSDQYHMPRSRSVVGGSYFAGWKNHRHMVLLAA
jgi:hypothetical protein